MCCPAPEGGGGYPRRAPLPYPSWPGRGGILGGRPPWLGYPPPPAGVDRQTPVKTVPYHRTAYAVGNIGTLLDLKHFTWAVHWLHQQYVSVWNKHQLEEASIPRLIDRFCWCKSWRQVSLVRRVSIIVLCSALPANHKYDVIMANQHQGGTSNRIWLNQFPQK